MPKSYRIKKIPQGTWVAESPTDVIAFPDFYNPLDYGPPPDGVSSNSATIKLAAQDAANNGGGIVFLSEGIWRGKNLPLYSNVSYVGSGIGTTIIKLEDGANTDLFSANTGNINLSGASGTGSATGTNYWSFSNLTLDGNKANQSSGTSYCIRAYGYGHMLEHVEILNGYLGGILLDWNNTANPTPPANALMPRWYDVMAHDCNGIGIQIGGPTDFEGIGINGFGNGSHNLHLGPDCVSAQLTNCHFWAPPLGVGAVGALIEAGGCTLKNFISEGSDTCQLVILGNDTIWDGQLYAFPPGRNGRGLQLGQPAGGTPIPGQIFQSGGVRTAAAANVGQYAGKIRNCNAGAIDEQNTSSNIYNLNVYQTGGTGIVGGYPNALSAGAIAVEGLTLDGSPGTGGIFQIANMNSFNGFRVFDKDGGLLFNIDTFSKVFAVENGRTFTGYSDAGVTPKYTLNAADGSIVLGNSSALRSGSGAPAAGLGNNGDYYFRTDTPGTANQRIYVKSAGAWVGIV